ncbi:MAG: fasciclin domain-containing protein, partial [Mesorhizobium sp.]
MRKLATLLLASTIGLSALGAVAYAANPMVGGAPMYAKKNIIENAVNSKDHTT